jgi:galacturan 1,4-alpha-galacturonidase
VNIEGNIDLPKQVSVVQQKINSTANPASTYATPWIYFQGEQDISNSILSIPNYIPGS